MTTTSMIFKVRGLDEALNAVTLKAVLMFDGSILGYNPIIPKKTDPTITIEDENHALKNSFLLIKNFEAKRAATVKRMSENRMGFAR